MSTVLLETLKKKNDFVKVSQSGNRFFTKGFILQKYRRNLSSVSKENIVRIGFIITKRIGGAVVRNKIKRIFRAIIKELLNNYLKRNYDYVIVANKKSLVMSYEELKDDLIKVIK